MGKDAPVGKKESARLKVLLEHTHGKALTEADLRVILRGKSLEYYSKHYGKVFTGEDQRLDVRQALLGINQLLDELIEDSGNSGPRPPENTEPLTLQFLRLFSSTGEIARDDLHKTLKGTGISSEELVSKGWIKEIGKTFYAKPITERFSYFTSPHITRKVLKTDLDQAHFLIGAALPGSKYDISEELKNSHFRIKKSVDDILRWYSRLPAGDDTTSKAAKDALSLVENWRASKKKTAAVEPSLFDLLEEEI
jgi:hypothetical protein